MKIENLFSQVQNAGVSVGEEAEVMGEGIVIDGMPISADEGADKEQERRLRLMEIGDELIDYMEGVTGFNHDLCLGV